MQSMMTPSVADDTKNALSAGLDSFQPTQKAKMAAASAQVERATRTSIIAEKLGNQHSHASEENVSNSSERRESIAMNAVITAKVATQRAPHHRKNLDVWSCRYRA